jgi:hypothetical protein
MFPFNKNTISLIIVTVIVLLFFAAGIFGILNYFIVKVLLFGGVAALAIMVSVFLFKSSLIKNRPEDKLQDDSN